MSQFCQTLGLVLRLRVDFVLPLLQEEQEEEQKEQEQEQVRLSRATLEFQVLDSKYSTVK